MPLVGFCQQMILLTPLQKSLNESSGLIELNQKLITHNDSGGKSILYEFDTTSGAVTREVFVENTENVDWEDLCHDDTFIYIADIGNNDGSRTDLKIYRISISDYILTPNDTVTADEILFSYSDQTDYSNHLYSTNYDAEAIISYDDSLYIFTKNWKNNWTNIYALSKIPGDYKIDKKDSINSQGLVTGAAFDSNSNCILLSGYTSTSSFVIKISDYTSDKLTNGTIERFALEIPKGFSYQIESISSSDNSKYYITAEENSFGSSGLYRLYFHTIVGLKPNHKKATSIYPNPASNFIHIAQENFGKVELYDSYGRLKMHSLRNTMDISNLCQGIYIAHIKNVNGEVLLKSKLIIK